MRPRAVHICRHTAGLDELTRRQQAVPRLVLGVLARTKRFSVFEASDNQVIARTMTYLSSDGFFRATGGAFPWTEVELTPAGERLVDGRAN